MCIFDATPTPCHCHPVLIHPHGNSKRKKSFCGTREITKQQLKTDLEDNNHKNAVDKVFKSKGNKARANYHEVQQNRIIFKKFSNNMNYVMYRTYQEVQLMICLLWLCSNMKVLRTNKSVFEMLFVPLNLHVHVCVCLVLNNSWIK